MYIPPAFREQHLPTLHAFMEDYGFATFLSAGDPPFVTHLPLLIDTSRGPNGTLLGHVAKANPHAALLNGTRHRHLPRTARVALKSAQRLSASRKTRFQRPVTSPAYEVTPKKSAPRAVRGMGVPPMNPKTGTSSPYIAPPG